MDKHIESYYRTERISSAFLSAVGAGSAIAGLGFYIWKGTPFSAGLMLGLCLIGTYQIIVGLVRLIRSRQRFHSGMESITVKNGHLRNAEYPRVVKKEEKIKTARYLELGTLISCMIILAFFLFVPFSQSILGSLLGLTFHSAFLFSFDLFSQFRLQEYIHQLEKYLR